MQIRKQNLGICYYVNNTLNWQTRTLILKSLMKDLNISNNAKTNELFIEMNDTLPIDDDCIVDGNHGVDLYCKWTIVFLK